MLIASVVLFISCAIFVQCDLKLICNASHENNEVGCNVDAKSEQMNELYDLKPLCEMVADRIRLFDRRYDRHMSEIRRITDDIGTRLNDEEGASAYFSQFSGLRDEVLVELDTGENIFTDLLLKADKSETAPLVEMLRQNLLSKIRYAWLLYYYIRVYVNQEKDFDWKYPIALSFRSLVLMAFDDLHTHYLMQKTGMKLPCPVEITVESLTELNDTIEKLNVAMDEFDIQTTSYYNSQQKRYTIGFWFGGTLKKWKAQLGQFRFRSQGAVLAARNLISKGRGLMDELGSRAGAASIRPDRLFFLLDDAGRLRASLALARPRGGFTEHPAAPKPSDGLREAAGRLNDRIYSLYDAATCVSEPNEDGCFDPSTMNYHIGTNI